MKIRLDILLCGKGFVETRSRARQLIKAEYVLVNGRVCKKSGFLVDENDSVEVLESPFIYVSRGGVKLKRAVDFFKIDLRDKICLDIGSSTGGFSDCMLKEGASRVYCVDVGSGQLHQSLRDNKRIFVFENTDIRDFKTDVQFDFVAVDVSFISIKLILPKIFRLLRSYGEAVVLIKPQFEVGPGVVKKGIVKDKEKIDDVLSRTKLFCEDAGFEVLGIVCSPIKGKEGNIEYLMHLKPSSSKLTEHSATI